MADHANQAGPTSEHETIDWVRPFLDLLGGEGVEVGIPDFGFRVLVSTDPVTGHRVVAHRTEGHGIGGDRLLMVGLLETLKQQVLAGELG